MRFSALVLTFGLVCASLVVARAEPFETKATVALLIDEGAGMALLDKGGDKPIEPASMAKLMVMAVVGDALEKGETSLTADLPVSESAWRTGGAPSGTATMFAALRSRIPVQDLLRGVAVQAANDACLILAEGLSGSEAAFVERMNTLAAQIGLTGSVFKNATGQPVPGQVMTARDLARLSTHIRQKHPDLYRLYGEPDFTWNKIFQRNRNPLIGQNIGAEGLVAGGTKDNGFSLVGVVTRGDRRLTLVISGLATAEDRLAEARRLLDWGFGSFGPRTFFDKSAVVGSAQVFGGDAWSVPVATIDKVEALVRMDAPEKMEARIAYLGPIAAPVKAGQRIGELQILRDGIVGYRAPLVATADVGVGSVPTRAFGSIIELFAALWHKGAISL